MNQDLLRTEWSATERRRIADRTLLIDAVERTTTTRSSSSHPRARSRRSRKPYVRIVIAATATLAGLAAWQVAQGPSGPASSTAAPWQLVANLIGPQFALSTDSPAAVAGITCGIGTTCFLSTGYSRDLDVGGAMYSSSDAGRTWHPTPLPTGVATTTAVTCASTQWCAAGGGKYDASLGDPGAGKADRDPELLVTADGGRTWQATPIPLPVVREPGFAVASSIDAVSCGSPEKCIAAVTVTQPRRAGAGHFTWNEVAIVGTTDGGVHWSMKVLPGQSNDGKGLEDGGSDFVSMSCPTAGACNVISQYLSTNTLRFWHSSDGGATWRMTTRGAITALYPQSFVCSSSATCTVLAGVRVGRGSAIALLQTKDAGTTWSSLPIPRGDWESASCWSPTSCFIGGSSFAETVDGGHTWRTVKLPHVGGSTIEQTTDGGLTWHRTKLPTKSDAVIAHVVQLSCDRAGTCEALALERGEPQVAGWGSLVLTNAVR